MMGPAEPGGEEEHGTQEQAENQQESQSFHSVFLSWCIVAGPGKNLRPNSVWRAHVMSPCLSLMRAVPGRWSDSDTTMPGLTERAVST